MSSILRSENRRDPTPLILISENRNQTSPTTPNAIGIEKKNGNAVQRCGKGKSSERTPTPASSSDVPTKIESPTLVGKSLDCLINQTTK